MTSPQRHDEPDTNTGADELDTSAGADELSTSTGAPAPATSTGAPAPDTSTGAPAPGSRREDYAGHSEAPEPATMSASRIVPHRVIGWTGLFALAVATFFLCYWRQSQSVPVSSDGASNVLQAWDMLHGNLLLHNWWVSDVSFYTTELPQYMLIEALLGLGLWVVNVAAAMTYTLLVLLAALLARGRARGRKGLARALLAAGIMLAPQLSATSILLGPPDHTGTAVPVLVIWLVIEGAGPGRRCRPGGTIPGNPPCPGRNPSPRTALGIPLWIVPVAVCVMFTWAMVADSIVLVTGIVPLVLVCAVRACPGLVSNAERRAQRRYEISLAGAAAIAGVIGSFAPRIVAALGAYREWHVGTGTDLSLLPHGAWVTFRGILELFGANVFGASPTYELIFVIFHLAGFIAVVCGLGIAAAQFFRSGDLLVGVFAVAIVLNLGAYLISTHARDLAGAREMVAVLPLGAVLAGRTLGERALTVVRTPGGVGRWFRPALAVIAAGYLGALAYGAVQPAVPPANQPLAAWLVEHRLSGGLAGYWQANSTTLDSGRRVLVSAVTLDDRGKLVPYQWETDDANYDPALHYANFVVAGGPAALPGMQAAAARTFGRPLRVYRADGYTIMVWDANLLARLG